jgi:prepilin-type N-terminal cleavage/methylation domain-containing protein
MRKGRLTQGFHRAHRARHLPRVESGFTLIELLIVTAVIPLVVGALSVGLLSVFSLQSTTQARLADSSDVQAVSAGFETDVQGALTITTATNTAPLECGTGSQPQILAMEWNLDQQTGFYKTLVSYVEVPNGSSNNSVNLERQLCTGTGTTQVNATPVSTSVLSYNFPQSLSDHLVTLSCTSDDTACNTEASTQFISTSGVTNVSFNATELTAQQASEDEYTLVAAPEATATPGVSGAPITPNTTTKCGFASPGSGTYAPTMCFVDFAPLSGAALQAAERGCLEMSVALPGNNVMYFCLGITGGPVAAYTLPTYLSAFLGNTYNSQPFYTDIPGAPGLEQSSEGTTSTITFSNITVVSAQGIAASGWEATSADAESTDGGESITWKSNAPLYVIPNSEAWDTPSDPVGTACDNGVDLTGGSTPSVPSTQVVCAGLGSGGKTGAAMVEALSPKTMSATMVGTGIEAITFGLLLS